MSFEIGDRVQLVADPYRLVGEPRPYGPLGEVIFLGAFLVIVKFTESDDPDEPRIYLVDELVKVAGA